MNLEKFNKMEELKFLAGNLGTCDEFTEEYENILRIATGDNELLKAMKPILMGQICFMMNQHLALQIEDRNKNIQ